jgi:DNA-binding transcriptional ArsR family regulator
MTDVSIWTATADPKRRQIIILLEEKPRTNIELSTHFDVSPFAVKKHLKVPGQANLRKARWEQRSRRTPEFFEQSEDSVIEANGACTVPEAADNSTFLCLNRRVAGNSNLAAWIASDSHGYVQLEQRLEPSFEKGIPYQHNP